MTGPEIVLVHGVATTAAVWSRVTPLLDDFRVSAVERPATGSLDLELEWLAPHARDRVVVGASGGATLAIALAAAETRVAGVLAHEPAVGSLVPGLLAPVAEAFAKDGVAGFGRALYGDSWEPAMAGPDPDAVARELPMFRAFEPSPARPGQGAVLVTVGAESPEPRQRAAAQLHERLGYRVLRIPGARHFAHWDNPHEFASAIRAFVADL